MTDEMGPFPRRFSSTPEADRLLIQIWQLHQKFLNKYGNDFKQHALKEPQVIFKRVCLLPAYICVLALEIGYSKITDQIKDYQLRSQRRKRDG